MPSKRTPVALTVSPVHEDAVRRIAASVSGLGYTERTHKVRRLFLEEFGFRVSAELVCRLLRDGAGGRIRHEDGNTLRHALEALDDLDRGEEAHGCMYFHWPGGRKPANACDGDPPPEFIESRLVVLRRFRPKRVRDLEAASRLTGLKHLGSCVRVNGRTKHASLE